MRYIIPSLIACTLLPAVASVDPKIAEFCLKAQDFQGCVKSLSGDSSGSTTTVRQIQQKGADLAEGNQCPAGFAYIGSGNCQEVKCRGGSGMGHDYRLAGKGWSCKKVLGMFGGELYLDGAIVRASLNNDCPKKEPRVGYSSSCNDLRVGEDYGESSAPTSTRSDAKNFNMLEQIDGCRQADMAKIEEFSDAYYECMQKAEELKRRYRD